MTTNEQRALELVTSVEQALGRSHYGKAIAILLPYVEAFHRQRSDILDGLMSESAGEYDTEEPKP